jgi:hypothetical protein
VLEVATVEHEGVIRLAEEHRELVEHSRGDPDEFVLGAPQGHGQAHPGRPVRLGTNRQAG